MFFFLPVSTTGFVEYSLSSGTNRVLPTANVFIRLGRPLNDLLIGRSFDLWKIAFLRPTPIDGVDVIFLSCASEMSSGPSCGLHRPGSSISKRFIHFLLKLAKGKRNRFVSKRQRWRCGSLHTRLSRTPSLHTRTPTNCTSTHNIHTLHTGFLSLSLSLSLSHTHTHTHTHTRARRSLVWEGHNGSLECNGAHSSRPHWLL